MRARKLKPERQPGDAPRTLVAALAAATVLVACGSRSSTAAGASPSDSSEFAVCPGGLQPTFESIRANILDLSCGTSGSICHSAEGGVDSGQLVLAKDPYGALLGADGTGEFASNISGSVRDLRRVVPGDPAHSFLVIKLGTKTLADPEYGAGMPRTAPGSVCPAALQSIEDWIAAGAKP